MWFRPRIADPHSASAPCPTDDDPGILLTVADGRLLAARPAGGAPVVRVVSGSVWITQEGRLRDHIVHSGGCLALDRHGRIVIQALTRSGARVRIADAAPLAPR